MEKMNALVIHAYGDFRYEEIEKPKAGPGEVVIKVGAAGICAADVKMYSQTHGPWPLNFPVISGHEFVGTVVDLGEGAAEKFGLSVGDKATAELIVPCRNCYYCKNGMYHHCINATYLCIHDHGGMAEYMRFPTNAIVHKIPAHVPLTEAVMAEPLSCAIHGVELAGVGLDDVVVVSGLGPIGMSMLQVCRLKTPRMLMGLSRRDSVNGIAKELGADYAFNVTKDDVVNEINRLTDGIGCDVYMEASGNNEALELGMEVLRKSGRMLVMGVYEGKASLDFNYVSEFKELQIIGGHLSPNKFPLAIRHIAEGKVNAKKMVTHQFPLKDFKRAMETKKKKTEEAVIKVVLIP